MPIDNNSSDSVFWHYSEEKPQVTNIYFKTMIRFSHKRLTSNMMAIWQQAKKKKKILNGTI